MAVPKVIHQIWLGGAVPEAVREWTATWPRLHPGWEYTLWTDANSPTPASPEAFDRMPTPAGKADLLRLQLLREHGGVYVDADFEAHRAMDPLVRDRNLTLLSQHGIVCNGFAASAPGHPFIAAVEDRAIEATLAAGERELLSPHLVSGPYLWNDVFIDQGLAYEAPDSLLPPDFFFAPHTRYPHALERSVGKRYATDHALATWQRRSSMGWHLRRTRLRTRLRRFIDLTAP